MFVRKMRFSKLHVFPFSPRSGTVAYDLNKKNKVDQLIKKERARHLMNIGIELETEYTKQFVEKEVSVLVESKDEQKCIGYTRHYIKTAIYDHDIRVNEIVKVIPILYEDRKCLIARTAVTNSIHKR
jgi:threonylcarbamoyladenosine tRNA methylthiotransferase MtaB